MDREIWDEGEGGEELFGGPSGAQRLPGVQFVITWGSSREQESLFGR